MSTQMIYTDIYGKKITDQQLEELQDYRKHIFENGELRTVEYWSFNWLQNKVVANGGEYFALQNEDVADIISQFSEANGRWYIYYNKVANAQGHAYWEYQILCKGLSENSGKVVFDTQKREIAESIFSNFQNRYAAKSKKFYGNPEVFTPAYDGAPTFTFIYDSLSGQPVKVLCEYEPELDSEYTMSQFFANQNIMADFDWSQHPYYHNFEPMLP